MTTTTWATLDKATGGLSAPGKMPGAAWSIPAEFCKVGSILREKVPNSPCAKCYALKNRYVFPNVRAALARRHATYLADPDAWAVAMEASIRKKGLPEFRWFDAGDIIDVRMLRLIAKIARQLPDIAFWLPTQQRAEVREFLASETKPDNLTIRLSAPLIGLELRPATQGLLAGIPVSTVRTKGTEARKSEWQCPAPEQGHKCVNCRACWDNDVPVVSYKGQ